MAAYVIVHLEVVDQALYAEYGKAVLATIEAHGGRFLVRGGAVEVFEGDFVPKRVVVLEFPDIDAARHWYRSPEYAPLIAMRKRAARGSLYIVAGA
ncbi:MAG TPA: DUF1330 domain-containing protein [Casimicrobiaceae bacterium]